MNDFKMMETDSVAYYSFAHGSRDTNAMKKAQELAQQRGSCVEVVDHVRKISLPWSFIARLDDGIKIILDKVLCRYRKKLAGVPIARGRPELPETVAVAVEDQPQFHINVSCKFAVFRPRVGAKLPARVVRVDEGQIVCSVYGVVTANIWRHQVQKKKHRIDVNVGDKVTLKVKKIRLYGRFLQLDADLRRKRLTV